MPPPASDGVDRPAAIAAVHRLLVALGQDTADPQLRDTPRRVVDALEPDWLFGVGAFAQKKAEVALSGKGLKVGKILHPSPANPAANRGWAEAVTKQLDEQGIW